MLSQSQQHAHLASCCPVLSAPGSQLKCELQGPECHQWMLSHSLGPAGVLVQPSGAGRMGLPQLAAVAPGQGGDTESSCTGGTGGSEQRG